MKHFDLVGTIDVDPIVKALKEYNFLWTCSTERQTTQGSPHTDTEVIYLRMPYLIDKRSIFDDLDVTEYPVMSFPEFYDAVEAVAKLAYASPARAMITKLKPNGHIIPHIDEGPYSDATDRYHCVLTTNDKCLMRIGDDHVFGKPTEVWYFDKHAEHEVLNNGDTDRIHLIVDVWKD